MSDDILAAIAQLGTDLRGEIAKLGSDVIGKLNASEERLLTATDAIRDDITVLGGMSDSTRKAGDNTREEVRDLSRTIADLHRVVLKHGSRLDHIERRLPPDTT